MLASQQATLTFRIKDKKMNNQNQSDVLGLEFFPKDEPYPIKRSRCSIRSKKYNMCDPVSLPDNQSIKFPHKPIPSTPPTIPDYRKNHKFQSGRPGGRSGGYVAIGNDRISNNVGYGIYTGFGGGVNV
jgi:hypothetical protein